MNGKGQVSIEFLIIVIVLLSLFLFSLFVFNEKNSGLIFSKQGYEARLLAGKLAGTINEVYLAGDGAEARILLENKGDFNVSIANGAAIVEWQGNYVAKKLMTGNASASPLSLGKWVNVRNVSGVIEVENS